MRHFAAAKLQLHAHLVSPVQEFFTVPDFGKIIVLVDINAKLDFFQLGAGWPFILGVFGNIVSELSKIDDLTHRRSSRRRDFDKIEPKTLSFAQGIAQFQDAELFAGGS
jgi:hypothetical protein